MLGFVKEKWNFSPKYVYIALLFCYWNLLLLSRPGEASFSADNLIGHQGQTKFVNATTGLVYRDWVSRGKEVIYHMNYTFDTKSANERIIRLSVKSDYASSDYPVMFVIRLLKGVRSWTVPYIAADGKSFYHVARSICPELNMNKNGTMPYFHVEVTTESTVPIKYSLHAYVVEHFTLQIGSQNAVKNVSVNPAEPMYFRYKFGTDYKRVLVKVESTSKTCGVVLVQNSKCPIFEGGTDDYAGLYATVTTKAAITVARDVIGTDQFYVILLVKDKDTNCLKHKGDINPFKHDNSINEKHRARARYGSEGNTTKQPFVPLSNSQRTKYFTVTILQLPSNHQYKLAIVASIFSFGSFYIMALLIFVVRWCNAEDGGRSFLAYLVPSKVKVSSKNDTEDGETDPLITIDSESHGYGVAIEANGRKSRSKEMRPVSRLDNNASPRQPSVCSELDQDYDLLDDIDKHKDVYRLKKNLYLSDITKKSYKKLRKRFNIYSWNVITIAVFYALPVIQLVLTYQRVVNTSGDQDICYYNFLCARPFSVFSSFNNVFSNIGYVMLGILFLLLVLRSDRLGKQEYVKSPETERKYGMPKQYGILYAMGFALIMEGVLSACYHVCPNYSNFQFDTAFMYIIGLLGGLRLYQARHHDIVINGHLAFTSFAAVIFTSVIGVVFRSTAFWAIFLILHLSCCVYLSVNIYYMGRVKAACKSMLMLNRRDIRHGPFFKDRFVLLIIFNIVNATLSIYGIVKLPQDFATYLLGIIILNGLLYVIFYVIMKLRYRESLMKLPLLFMFLSLVTWGFALHFFTQGVTNWQLSPAKSREGNRECILFNFFDDHDVWHFLSSMAMFFTFMSVMTIDDDLEHKERTKINVF